MLPIYCVSLISNHMISRIDLQSSKSQFIDGINKAICLFSNKVMSPSICPMKSCVHQVISWSFKCKKKKERECILLLHVITVLVYEQHKGVIIHVIRLGDIYCPIIKPALFLELFSQCYKPLSPLYPKTLKLLILLLNPHNHFMFMFQANERAE